MYGGFPFNVVRLIVPLHCPAQVTGVVVAVKDKLVFDVTVAELVAVLPSQRLATVTVYVPADKLLTLALVVFVDHK